MTEEESSIVNFELEQEVEMATPTTPAFPNKFEEMNMIKTDTSFNVKAFLSSISCHSNMLPLEMGPIITAYEDDSISDVFQKLIQHQLQSLPIIDVLTRKPLYVVSMAHIVDFLLNLFDQSDFNDDIWHKMIRYFSDPASHFSSTKINQMEGKINRSLDPVYTISSSSNLYDAVKMMVDKKCHRLIVVDGQGMMVSLITQSRVIQLLHSVIDTIPNLSKSVSEIGIGSSPVLSVFDNKKTYDAFKYMNVTGISALAVIDQNGTLVGNISLSDLKLIGYDMRYWNMLGKPTGEYIKNISSAADSKIKSFALAYHNLPPYPPTPSSSESNQRAAVVSCRSFHSFAFVLRLISFYRVHRVYIVDDTGKASTIITLSDALKEILKA